MKSYQLLTVGLLALLLGCSSTNSNIDFKDRYNASRNSKPDPDSTIRVQIKPKLLKHVAPEYPAEARKIKKSGTVSVAFIVEKDGNIAKPRIVESSDHVFDDYAITAVRQWIFEPATIDGRPVNCKMSLIFKFEL